MPSYDTFFGMQNVTHLFTTERGSTYAMFSDSTTIRDRSGVNHLHDKSEGIQPKSFRTVFMSREATLQVSGIFQNSEIPTEFLPEKTANGWVAKVVVTHNEGGFKAGQVLARAPFSTTPILGSYPVEIFDHASPLGSTGSGVHFGNKVTGLTPAAPTQAAVPQAVPTPKPTMGGAATIGTLAGLVGLSALVVKAIPVLGALKELTGYGANKAEAERHLQAVIVQGGVPKLSTDAIAKYGEVVAGARIEQAFHGESKGFTDFIEWGKQHRLPIDALLKLNPTTKSKEQIEEALANHGALISQIEAPEVKLAQAPNVTPRDGRGGGIV